MSLEQAKERIFQLEEATERLYCVRQHLVRNAAEICGEVRSSVCCSIDCLRSREVALLEEVEAVRCAKEQNLQRQQGRLSQAISLLRKAITVVHENTASEKHLADTLERLTKLDLSPEETPYIGFCADNVHMMEQLTAYGRVDNNGLPLPSAFEDPSNPSASLPRQIEEYEDQEHHIFYKTLQEIHRPAHMKTIKVNIPKLSQRPEDWLLHKPTTISQKPVTLGRETMHQAVTNMFSPSCSLDNWLSLIKNNAESEEEHNFEIVDQSKGKDYDLLKWLDPVSAQTVSQPNDLFDHISKDSQVWLTNVCQQLANVQGVQRDHEDMFSHIESESSSWLRSKASSRHGSPAVDHECPKDFFSHITKDKTKWLKTQSLPATKMEPMATSYQQDPRPSNDKWLICRPQPTGRPRPLPLTKSFAQLTSMADYMWLKAPPSTSQPQTDLFSSFPSVGNSAWLHKTHGVAMEISRSPCLGVMDTSDNSFGRCEEKPSEDTISDWLMKSCSENLDEACNDLKSISLIYDNSLWLKGDSYQNQKSSLSLSTGSSIASPYSDWLLIPCRESSDERPSDVFNRDSTNNIEDKKKSGASETDSWSVCSAPPSTSGDQHAKDVAIADDYYTKWLM